MHLISEREKILGKIESYLLRHDKDLVTITFLEGDSYLCLFDSNDWCDSGVDIDSPDYEEWFALSFIVRETLIVGPNKDPRYRYIDISEKLMPYKVQCGDTVLYVDGKLLI